MSVRPQANRLLPPQPTKRGTFSRGDALVVPITLAALPYRNHSHRETGKSVWMRTKCTATVIAREGHRGTVRHASAQTKRRTHPAVQKQRGEKNDPKSRQHRVSHSRHARNGLAISARDASQRHAVAKPFLQSTVQILLFLRVCAGEQKRRGAQKGTSAKQEVRLDSSDTCGTALTSTITHGGSTHHSTKKETKENTAAGCSCVCVRRCGCLPALAAIKQNKRERNVCSAPQALVARPHVTAPSARGASRPLLMRAAGEAHRAVVM
ncbi:hypothetical protein MOQ_005370, partial [Trypanosoma cruzi marinkellei]